MKPPNDRRQTLLIDVGKPFTIKVMKLSGPPRLSIDIINIGNIQGPLPANAAQPAKAFNYRVVLDPGHGGYSIGIISGSVREKDICLSIAKNIANALFRRNDRNVFLTRRADQYMSITDRAVFANQKSPDVFISIHLSGSDDFVIYTAYNDPNVSDMSVAEQYSTLNMQRSYVEKSRAFADSLGKAIKDEFGTNVIFREMNLPVLDYVGSTAVMLEIPKTIVYDSATKTRLSGAILKGMASYAGK